MTTSTRFYIENSGVIKETVHRESIQVSTDVLAQYAGEKANRVPVLVASEAIHPLLHGCMGMVVKGNTVGFTVLLKRLPLRARFKVNKGTLVPDFGGESSPMLLEWVVPDDMYVAMLIICVNGVYQPSNQYLFAVDHSSRTYRLPTSNVYEDARICAGRYASSGSTAVDMVSRAVAQLEASEWQQDLINANDLGLTPRLFRFKPLDKDGFEQLPYDGEHWTNLCRKFANETVTNFMCV